MVPPSPFPRFIPPFFCKDILMRNPARIAIAFVGASALMGTLVAPASAADSTTTTIVDGGGITITVPTSVSLPSVKPGATTTATVAGVKVTDERAGQTGWKADAQITNFVANTVTIGGTTTKASIAATNATYTAGAAAFTGTATVAATTGAQALGGTTAVTTQTATAVSGNNTATWDATLSLAAPSNALADTYTATLTQSAA